MPAWLHARWFGVVLLIAVVAGVAATAISFVTAYRPLHHRGAYVPAAAPADSGMAYQTIPLRARDGTVLSGWWIPPADGRRRPDLAVVVLAHAEDGRWTRPASGSPPGSRPVSGKVACFATRRGPRGRGSSCWRSTFGRMGGARAG